MGMNGYSSDTGNAAFAFVFQASNAFPACPILDSASSMYSWDVFGARPLYQTLLKQNFCLIIRNG
ncbi:hypothetical protein VI06_19240 [Aquitalea magnusonii]|nr:hypothetical protein VI06_19240 [Aquitalea magnusonii]